MYIATGLGGGVGMGGAGEGFNGKTESRTLHYKPTMILPTWRFQEQNYFDLFQEV
jgi:hypothetical protein